ncbi:MAG: T9SS type A sorting domain-containing protein [Crocinitomicaceae bacterium]|nr:T9SS type A sorting domain-containing protein [Crocinitomicaceae bacterium]
MKRLTLLCLFALSAIISTAQIQCVDLSSYDDQYVNSVGFDDITYPIGSAFIVSGDIQYVKPSSGNAYQGIISDSLFYIGDLDINVSTSTCLEKELTFSCAYLEGLAVDGDTVFSQLNPPANYGGATFDFEFDGAGSYTITGDFDVVSLYTQTNFLYDVCLDCASSTIDCVDLSSYDDTYVNSVGFNDITYPIGSAFIVSGDIQYVKPSSGNYYQGINGDALFYMGDLDIDVSTSICTDKILTFNCAYLEGLSVDGDTVFTMLNAPASFAGSTWDFEYDGAGNYTVTGDFVVVSLYTQTNELSDVCLDCNYVVSMNETTPLENQFSVYPNPSSNLFIVSSNSNHDFSFELYDTNGTLIISENSNGTEAQIDLSNYKDGLYILSVTDKEGYRITKKLIKVN